MQAKKLTSGKRSAYQPGNDRKLRLRWLALMLYLASDVSGYAQEFEEVVLLAGRHADEAAQECQLLEVSHSYALIAFRYVSQEGRHISKGDIRYTA